MSAVTHSKIALTDLVEVIFTVQVREVPVQSPDHPMNLWLRTGLALSLTVDPVLKDLLAAVHRVAQDTFPETEPKAGFVLVSNSEKVFGFS